MLSSQLCSRRSLFGRRCVPCTVRPVMRCGCHPSCVSWLLTGTARAKGLSGPAPSSRISPSGRRLGLGGLHPVNASLALSPSVPEKAGERFPNRGAPGLFQLGPPGVHVPLPVPRPRRACAVETPPAAAVHFVYTGTARDRRGARHGEDVGGSGVTVPTARSRRGNEGG